MTNSPATNAIVISSTRRFVTLLDAQGEHVQATTSSKALEVCVGDRVSFEAREGDNFITSIAARDNELVRSYRNETKTMAANLDHVFIVTAVGQAFNPIFIDRVIAVSFSQAIPCSIVLNKVDQGLEGTQAAINLYQSLGFDMFCISAKFGHGLPELSKVLESVALNAVALVGVSGVGKSTLLNRYVPSARSRTQEVNERTGLGRQTTTQALAHVYSKEGGQRLLFIDMPGLQSFGVGHLLKDQIARAFPEIEKRRGLCEYSDCGHVREQVCAIRQAAEDGDIAASRYLSYVRMIEEVEEQEEF